MSVVGVFLHVCACERLCVSVHAGCRRQCVCVRACVCVYVCVCGRVGEGVCGRERVHVPDVCAEHPQGRGIQQQARYKENQIKVRVQLVHVVLPSTQIICTL